MAAAVVAASAVAAGIVGPWLHRRRTQPERRSSVGSPSTPLDPVEAKRNAGPSYFRSPGA
jgi:hypothetical protein